MEVEFADDSYEQLYTDVTSGSGYAPEIVTAYRKRIQFLKSANDEKDLWAWRSLRFKKLKGNRGHQHSIRLNDQYRLIIEITDKLSGKIVNIIGIEDYH